MQRLTVFDLVAVGFRRSYRSVIRRDVATWLSRSKPPPLLSISLTGGSIREERYVVLYTCIGERSDRFVYVALNGLVRQDAAELLVQAFDADAHVRLGRNIVEVRTGPRHLQGHVKRKRQYR